MGRIDIALEIYNMIISGLKDGLDIEMSVTWLEEKTTGKNI